MKSFVMALTLATVLMASSNVLAQCRTCAPVGPVPVVTYFAPAPVASYGPVVTTSYYAPAPYYAAAPVPYFVASPVVAPFYVPPPVVFAPAYGWPVVIQPRVFVPGQPVRNVLRAVTP
ncbi:MAG: hypothetical protein WCJ35_20630 [Planctomycetota bacterium]